MPPLAVPLSRTWQDSAACKGEPMDLFYGIDGERGPIRDAREAHAKAICGECPVRLQCLAYAVALPEKWGIWGGLDEKAREGERRRRMRRVKPAA